MIEYLANLLRLFWLAVWCSTPFVAAFVIVVLFKEYARKSRKDK